MWVAPARAASIWWPKNACCVLRMVSTSSCLCVSHQHPHQAVRARVIGRDRARKGLGVSKMNEGPHVRGCSGHRTKPKALGRSAQSTLRRK